MTLNIVLSIFFFLGFLILNLFNGALSHFNNIEQVLLLSETKKEKKIVFCLRNFLKDGWKNLYLLVQLTKNILIVLYIILLLFLLTDLGVSKTISIVIITLFSITVNYIIFTLGKIKYKKMLYISSFFASFYIYLFLPLSNLFLTISKYIFPIKEDSEKISSLANINKLIDPKFLSSLRTFQEKVAREVMIPRVKIFGLPSNTTIRQVSEDILSQGFSRIPVFKDKIDNIIGVLMYKDVLKAYIQSFQSESSSSILDTPIESFVNPVIYTPENKKIFQLFQEFRLQKRHLAIVVNEYGGTEGIITIEDILEELVGEIHDEYDIEEERQIWKLPNNTWIVDAKLSIIDLEKKLNIHIPHSPEYETIGGFIFHKAGAIPEKGWSLLFDEFELEVLISSDRCIEKIRITPLIT